MAVPARGAAPPPPGPLPPLKRAGAAPAAAAAADMAGRWLRLMAAAGTAAAMLACLLVVLLQLSWARNTLLARLGPAGALGSAALPADTRSSLFPWARCYNSGCQPPAYCSFNGTLPVEAVRWSEPTTEAAQLLVEGCSLRRFSHEEALQCLAGKRLVFLGDSVTRYFYLTLLHFIDKGTWPAPKGGVPGQPSVANEHEWPSWNDFLRGTNALFGGRELCDCYRREWVEGQERKPTEDEKHENRFYTLRAGSSAGVAEDIFVSHITYTTFPNKVHGHFGFPPYPNGRAPCAPATCSAPADWAFHLAEALDGPIKDLRPTHLVVNSGLWRSSNSLRVFWPDIAAAGRRAVAAQQGRVIWRTTTANKAGPIAPQLRVRPGYDGRAINHTQAEGWELLDAFNITRPLIALKRAAPMWDGRHYQALVYRELAIYLLNMIC